MRNEGEINKRLEKLMNEHDRISERMSVNSSADWAIILSSPALIFMSTLMGMVNKGDDATGLLVSLAAILLVPMSIGLVFYYMLSRHSRFGKAERENKKRVREIERECAELRRALTSIAPDAF